VITFVLVPGACHGGWWYEPLAQRLEHDGHAAVPLTLAGLEDEPRLNRLITLATHIDEAAAAVPAAGDVVLVGHSYAGSVITGIADRMPERIAGLVYLDAFLPHDASPAG
jgi:thioesterase domain-containing protein